jgi:DNA (cytosine-5)-methyltransferase 1
MNGIEGKHSSAFWGFINKLKSQGEIAPPLVMVENVPGWLHSNKGSDFRLTVKALNDLGYACDVFTLDALRFIPQSRLRVFLLGTKTKVPSQSAESILSRPVSLLPNSLRKSIITNTDLTWFYNEIPEPPPLNKKGLAKIIEPLEDSDSRWWKEEEVKRHLAMMETTHYHRVMIIFLIERFIVEEEVVFRGQR